MLHFTHLKNHDEAAQFLASCVAEDLRKILAKKDSATLAVSGGRSPIKFFQELSQKDLDWARVNITLVDERIVPTKHDDSNSYLVHQHLLQNKAKAATWLPLIQDELDEEALKNNEQVLAFALKNFTQPDIAILGMGNDGHTASLFPQAPQLKQAIHPEYPDLLLITHPITVPHNRLTMTLAAIEQTPHLYLAISGIQKREIYNQAAKELTAQFPISYVLHSQKVQPHVIYND